MSEYIKVGRIEVDITYRRSSVIQDRYEVFVGSFFRGTVTRLVTGDWEVSTPSNSFGGKVAPTLEEALRTMIEATYPDAMVTWLESTEKGAVKCEK